MLCLRNIHAVTILLALSGGALAQQDPPQWNSSATFTGGGLVRASNGNFYRCLKNNMAHDPTKDPHQFWELYYVRANVTLTVAKSSATFTSVKQAWAMLQGASIAAGIKALISINSMGGTYTEAFAAPLDLTHPFGSHINIQGDKTANVTLNFDSGTDGIVLTDGNTFGGITGLTLDGSGTTEGYHGFRIDMNSSLGPTKVTIQNFTIGADVENHSSAQIGGCVFSNFRDMGIVAGDNSFVKAQAAVLNGNNGTAKGGIIATLNSTIDAHAANVNNSGVGFQASLWSLINASASTSTNNVSYGYSANTGGHILAQSNTTDANGTDFNIATNTSAPDQSYIEV